MSTPLKNPTLRGIEQQIEASLAPENRQNFMKVVVWGMSVGLSGGPKGLLATLRDSKDPVSDCALGAVNLVQMLRLQSQGTMPVQAMVPAAMVLMLNALDFAERARLAEIDNEQIVRATHIFTNQIFAVLGITPQMVHRTASAVQGFIEDPAKLELIRRRAGVVRDPRASLPVEVPAAAPAPNRAARRRQRRRAR
jgi:hypothetical protein